MESMRFFSSFIIISDMISLTPSASFSSLASLASFSSFISSACLACPVSFVGSVE